MCVPGGWGLCLYVDRMVIACKYNNVQYMVVYVIPAICVQDTSVGMITGTNWDPVGPLLMKKKSALYYYTIFLYTIF